MPIDYLHLCICFSFRIMDERGSDEEEISINLPRNNLTERRGFLDRLNLIQGGNVRRTLSFQSQSSTSSQAQEHNFEADNLISSPRRSAIMSQSSSASADANSTQELTMSESTEPNSQPNHENTGLEDNGFQQNDENQDTNNLMKIKKCHNVKWTETSRNKRKLCVDGYR